MDAIFVQQPFGSFKISALQALIQMLASKFVMVVISSMIAQYSKFTTSQFSLVLINIYILCALYMLINKVSILGYFADHLQKWGLSSIWVLIRFWWHSFVPSIFCGFKNIYIPKARLGCSMTKNAKDLKLHPSGCSLILLWRTWRCPNLSNKLKKTLFSTFINLQNKYLSPIFLLIQMQLVRLLVGLLVGKL